MKIYSEDPMIVAITGHRPDKLGGWKTPNPIYRAVVEAIDKKLVELCPSVVLTGMSLGVDQWAADLCIQNDIPFHAYIPFAGQSNIWPEYAQDKYKSLLERAGAVITVSDEAQYREGLMQERNIKMVQNCHILLAVWNGTLGGTSNCIKVAKKMGIKVVFADLPTEVMQYVPIMKQGPPSTVPFSTPSIPEVIEANSVKTPSQSLGVSIMQDQQKMMSGHLDKTFSTFFNMTPKKYISGKYKGGPFKSEVLGKLPEEVEYKVDEDIQKYVDDVEQDIMKKLMIKGDFMTNLSKLNVFEGKLPKTKIKEDPKEDVEEPQLKTPIYARKIDLA